MQDLLQGSYKGKAIRYLGMTSILDGLYMLYAPSFKWPGIRVPKFLTIATHMPLCGQN